MAAEGWLWSRRGWENIKKKKQKYTRGSRSDTTAAAAVTKSSIDRVHTPFVVAFTSSSEYTTHDDIDFFCCKYHHHHNILSIVYYVLRWFPVLPSSYRCLFRESHVAAVFLYVYMYVCM